MVRRPPHLPDVVRAALSVTGPALTFAPVTDGWAVVTREGLHLRLGERVVVKTWTDVDAARLDGETGELEITWVDGTPPARFTPPERSRLPRVVRERVQHSVVLAEPVPVPADRSLRVVLRRSADGTLLTQVVGNGQVDLADPAVRADVDAAEARLREAAGL